MLASVLKNIIMRSSMMVPKLILVLTTETYSDQGSVHRAHVNMNRDNRCHKDFQQIKFIYSSMCDPRYISLVQKIVFKEITLIVTSDLFIVQ